MKNSDNVDVIKNSTQIVHIHIPFLQIINDYRAEFLCFYCLTRMFLSSQITKFNFELNLNSWCNI